MIRVDRMRCGNANGIVVVCFDPPWWRLDRWIDWWFLSRGRAKGFVTVTVNGVSRSVRARNLEKTVVRPVCIRDA